MKGEFDHNRWTEVFGRLRAEAQARRPQASGTVATSSPSSSSLSSSSTSPLSSSSSSSHPSTPSSSSSSSSLSSSHSVPLAAQGKLGPKTPTLLLASQEEEKEMWAIEGPAKRPRLDVTPGKPGHSQQANGRSMVWDCPYFQT